MKKGIIINYKLGVQNAEDTVHTQLKKFYQSIKLTYKFCKLLNLDPALRPPLKGPKLAIYSQPGIKFSFYW